MLGDLYKAAISKANEYLLNKGYLLKICNKEDPDYPLQGKKEWGGVWIVERTLGSDDVNLLIALPVTFPDEFPQVFLSKKSFDAYFPLPHLDGRKFLCTFDPVESSPNPDKPGELIERFIERGFQVLSDGVAKRNVADYKDEFLAYWSLESHDNIFLLFTPDKEKRFLMLLPFSGAYREYTGVVAERLEDATNWCDAINIKYEASKATSILYLPLEDIGNPPYPSSNADLNRRLKEHSPNALKELGSYFKSKEDRYYVLFSLPSDRGLMLGFWHHLGLSKNKEARGFRRFYPARYLLQKHHDGKLKKYVVERVDRDRLFSRGGTGPLLSETSSVSIIGCGAVGSAIAFSCVRSGLSVIDLVDFEKLSTENIARHHCGFSDIGRSKSKALRDRLRQHYPYLKSSAYDKDILQLLLEDASFLNKYSLNIVALGSLPVEKRMNHLMQNELITSPLIFVWVEPLLVSGHALFVNPSRPGCFECIMDASYRVKYRVVEEPSKYFKREAGCQATYMPYPALEIDRFVNCIIRFVLSIVKGEVTESTLLTWIGDIDSFRNNGGLVSAYWAADSAYTEHTIDLEGEKLCSVCSGVQL
jgi:hypothetical protein